MDNKRISKYLQQLLDYREQDRSEKMEFNNYSKQDDDVWNSETNEIAAARDILDTSKQEANKIALKSQLQYLAADFDNFRKRQTKEKQLLVHETKKKAILSFLPIVDDMERLLKTIEDHEKLEEVNETDVAFEMIYNNLCKILSENNCEKIPCEIGEEFDVEKHEAVSTMKMQDSQQFKPNSICEIFQTGYILDGEVIRHAKVVVTEENSQKGLENE